MTAHITVLLLLSCYLISQHPTFARVLNNCGAAEELKRGGVPGSFITTYVCIMEAESHFDTKKKTGPGAKSSFAYGIFQISSLEWCGSQGVGGICKKNCKDFLDDDIQGDIICAKVIAEQRGFKHWKRWTEDCKDRILASLSKCPRVLEGE